jgi:membrane-bound serine protease (ClpP class)
MGLTIAIIVIFGIVLMILETILPGGVTGVLGALCTLAAVVLVVTGDGFADWPMWARTSLACGIVVGSGAAVLIWMRVFGKTAVHRTMTLEQSVPPPPDPQSLAIGTEGVAITELRPLGKADFTGSRREVRCEDGFAPAGSRLRVTGSEPGNLLVRVLS